MSRPYRANTREERGASLIIALVFIVVVSVVVGAISRLALNDLNNTTHFNTSTAMTYSATDVANLAIQSIRYDPQAVNNAIGPCWGSGVSEQKFNNVTIAIWCNSVAHSGSSQSRDVTMYAGTLPLCSTAAGCKADPLLTLVESYDDYSASGTDTCPTNPSSTTCGFGASTLVWTWGSLAQAVGGLILNTITITSSAPSNATLGGQYAPVATTTSGDPVVITPASGVTACTYSAGVVTFVSTGVCTLNFNDPGNIIYAQASEITQTFTIS